MTIRYESDDAETSVGEMTKILAADVGVDPAAVSGWAFVVAVERPCMDETPGCEGHIETAIRSCWPELPLATAYLLSGAVTGLLDEQLQTKPNENQG